MYHNKFVAAIRVAGKVLREVDEIVYVPLGSEYDILLKNLSTVRALVNVSIDGDDVTDGTQLIVPANGSLNLERYIRSGNMHKGNRFKFIERNDAVEAGRGIGAEDGLVRIEFEFERVQPPVLWSTFPPRNVPFRNYPTWNSQPYFGDGTTFTTTDTAVFSSTAGTYSDTVNTFNEKDIRAQAIAAGVFNAGNVGGEGMSYTTAVGITVPGEVSNQKFEQGEWFPTEGVKHAIVLRMVGHVGGQRVLKPVTVKQKPKCVTCGHVNKGTAKFCSQCGTSLTIV